MTQERQRVRIEKKQYFDRNIWDMSIDITYLVLDILQVIISRSAYYISFERMCLVYVAYMRNLHDDKIPHEPAAFCIRFQFLTYMSGFYNVVQTCYR